MSVDISNATATTGVDPSRLRIAGAIKQAAKKAIAPIRYKLIAA